jgi:hypothetical protein
MPCLSPPLPLPLFRVCVSRKRISALALALALVSTPDIYLEGYFSHEASRKRGSWHLYETSEGRAVRPSRAHSGLIPVRLVYGRSCRFRIGGRWSVGRQGHQTNRAPSVCTWPKLRDCHGAVPAMSQTVGRKPSVRLALMAETDGP